MKYVPFVVLIFSSIIIASPLAAQAYGTSAQTALRLSDTHSLYMISYDFGFLNRKTDLPIAAMRDSLSDNKSVVRYDLVNEQGVVSTTGTTYALIVSDRPIIDNKYHLDEGRAGKFTLVVIARHDVPTVENTALQITHLPMILTDNGKEKEFILAPSELTDYKTPFIR